MVERVRTGEKVRVEALADVGRLLAAMLAAEEAQPPPGAGPRPTAGPGRGRDVTPDATALG